MTNAQSIPLLRIPNLAREQVIREMDVREHYFLSKLSRKAKRLTRISVCRVTYSLDVEFKYPICRLEIRKTENYKYFRITLKPSDSEDCRISDLVIPTEEMKESLTNQLEFLHGQFKLSESLFQFYNVPHDITRQILGVVRSMNMGIHYLGVHSRDVLDNEMFEYIMDNFRDVKRLKNGCETTEDFSWDSTQPFNFDVCYLSSSPWLTLDHLSRLFKDCRCFTTDDYPQDLRLDEEINELVKWWMDDSTMEHISLVAFIDDLRGAMWDIHKEPVHTAWIDDEFYEFSHDKAFKIRQKCGREAIIGEIPGRWNTFTITTEIERVNEIVHFSEDEEDSDEDEEVDDEQEEDGGEHGDPEEDSEEEEDSDDEREEVEEEDFVHFY